SEDTDFFRRAIEKGHRFIWCDEALVFECVPPSRWTRRFMLKRALLRGGNSLKYPRNRLCLLAKSLVAIPAYGLALPFLQLIGHYLFMKYLIKLCDHTGRLLAVASLNPVADREM